jgi:hypothetical protein
MFLKKFVKNLFSYTNPFDPIFPDTRKKESVHFPTPKPDTEEEPCPYSSGYVVTVSPPPTEEQLKKLRDRDNEEINLYYREDGSLLGVVCNKDVLQYPFE